MALKRTLLPLPSETMQEGPPVIQKWAVTRYWICSRMIFLTPEALINQFLLFLRQTLWFWQNCSNKASRWQHNNKQGAIVLVSFLLPSQTPWRKAADGGKGVSGLKFHWEVRVGVQAASPTKSTVRAGRNVWLLHCLLSQHPAGFLYSDSPGSSHGTVPLTSRTIQTTPHRHFQKLT